MQRSAESGQPDLQTTRRVIQVIYFAFLGTLGIYWMVLEIIQPETGTADLTLIRPLFLALAGALAAVVVYLRHFRIPALLAGPSAAGTETIAKLRVYYILCIVLSEAVALYGFVLRFLGATRQDAGLFFLLAVVLFAVCYPRWPEAPVDRFGSRGRNR